MVKQQPDSTPFGRRRGVVSAWIRVHGRRYLPCVVRNLSKHGALLEFNEVPRRLPFDFQLAIEPSGAVYDCEVRHLGAHGVSVLFSNHDALAPPDDHDDRADSGAAVEWRGSNKVITPRRRSPRDQAGRAESDWTN